MACHVVQQHVYSKVLCTSSVYGSSCYGWPIILLCCDHVMLCRYSYDEVEVTNFHNSWKNGMAFCAVLDRHR